MSTKTKKPDQPAKAEPSAMAEKVASLRDYFEESKVEIKKVNWPSRKEVKTTTFAVLILVVVMSLFLGILDLGLVELSRMILSAGGKA